MNQREIKFRVWDIEKKRMVEIEFTEMDGGLFPVRGNWDDTIRPFDKECVLLQFTGLKDKNGREIYEGDIVKCPPYYQASSLIKNEKVEVIFEDGMFMAKGFGRFYQKDLTECEVIGNIYENPELLAHNLKAE